jgi:hypothetical protein
MQAIALGLELVSCGYANEPINVLEIGAMYAEAQGYPARR